MPAFAALPSPRTRAFALVLACCITGIAALTLGAQPQLPPTTPAAGSAELPPLAINDSSTIKVNFPSSPVQAIIPFYTQITGKKIILDSALQGEPLRIIAPQPLSRREAIAFIEATLLLNGYAIIPVDATTAKLIHHNGGKSPTPEGLKVYSSIRELPMTEELCHYVLPLQHISPDEASKAFQQVIKLHSYGAITPVTNAAALIITENSATIRSIHDIAQVIDVPPAEIANEMIKLERSDAESIAEIINEIYEEKEKNEASSQTQPAVQATVATAPGGRVPSPPPVQTASANSANTNPSVAKVKVIPYRRTNRLLVIARPVDITYIKGLVLQLDQQSDSVNFLKRKLRYMDVGDFLPVAYNALAKDTDIQSEAGDSGGGTRGSSSRRPKASANTPSTDFERSNRDTNSTGGMFGGFGNNNNGSGSIGSSHADRSLLDDPDVTGAPESLIVGKTLLIADPQSNSLIVSGSPEHIQIIDQLLQEIDVRPQQIYISTIIGHLNLDRETNYGVDFLRGLDDFTLRQKNVTQPGGAAAAAGALDIPFNMEHFGTGALSLYGQLGSLSRYINLFDGNKNFKVLSKPSMYTTNNGKAVISSGQRIAVPVNILSNAGLNNVAATSASIDYRDVVLKLEVVPLINSDDEVTLRIAQINDNIVGEQTISGNTVPTIGTQELLTTVTVKDGATVVLGGLITERTGDNRQGVKFLRHIPVIKHLFGTTEKVNTREELLIFIQPNIIKAGGRFDSTNHLEAARNTAYEEIRRFASPTEDVPQAWLEEPPLPLPEK